MEPIYLAAQAGSTWWEDVYSDGRRDLWQLAGKLFDGTLGGRLRSGT